MRLLKFYIIGYFNNSGFCTNAQSILISKLNSYFSVIEFDTLHIYSTKYSSFINSNEETEFDIKGKDL